MNSYILLRNNRQYGPYTLHELRSFGLNTSDLIWIEGESQSWQYAIEIEHLKTIATQGEKIPLPGELPEAGKTSISTSTGLNEEYNGGVNFRDNEKFYYAKRRPRKLLSVGTSVFGFIVFFIGVALCAFVVKKMVDGFGDEFSSTAEAKLIQQESLLVNNTEHFAFKNNYPEVVQTHMAISAENDSAKKKPIVAKPRLPSVINEERTLSAKNETITTTDSSSLTEALITTQIEKEINEEKTEIKQSPTPELTLTSNEYSVGPFGGISNLELSVHNPSSQEIEKAVVEVEFLKPNGSVVKSQQVFIENISAGGLKKIAVPSSNRGVKVRYKLVDLQTSL